MRTKAKQFLGLGICGIIGIFGVLAIDVPVFAASCGGINTSLINCGSETGHGEEIYEILALILNVLTYGVAAAGVLGIVISGIQYMTASGNEAQMTKAKNRIVQVVIGLFAYGLLWVFLEWLIPGGVI
ncbi:hypothetical protein IJ380_00310 [Candidatus Saccharibacteria bacterium]|nr:hypothetical protein [Candidatus Saccharibacteria bacterium]